MRRASSLILVAGLAACTPVVDGQFADVEVTRPDITIPALTVSTQPSVTFSFSMDSSPLGATSNLSAQDALVSVELHRLALAAKSGITDLSFIDSLHALACVPTSKTTTQSARQVEIADYERTSDAPVGKTFEVPIPEPVDLLPLLRPSSTEPRKILVIVNLGGKLPTSEWKADVSMSLAIEIRQ